MNLLIFVNISLVIESIRVAWQRGHLHLIVYSAVVVDNVQHHNVICPGFGYIFCLIYFLLCVTVTRRWLPL